MTDEGPLPDENEENVPPAPEAEEAEPPPELGHAPADSATHDEPEGLDTTDVEYVELHKIHNVAARAEARLLKGLLEENGIPCVVEDDTIDTLDGYVGGQLDGIDILVPVEFVEKARDTLAAEGIACGVDEAQALEFFDRYVRPAAGGSEEACRTAAQMLGKQMRDFRQHVLHLLAALGRDGATAARGMLRAACRAPDDSPLVHDIPKAIERGRFGKETPLVTVNDLARLGRDPSPHVRRRVATALGRLRGAGAGPPLVSLLSDAAREVRDEALESLYLLSGGETFGFDPEADPRTQEPAIVRWRDYVRQNPGA